MKLLSRRYFLGLICGFIFSSIFAKYNLKIACASKKSNVEGFNIYHLGVKNKKDSHLVTFRSKDLISWNGEIYPYVDYINQEVVDNLINEGISRLSGIKDIRIAWKKVFNYRKGEKVVIKPNFNWIETEFEKIVVSPQVINGIIKGLVEYVGVKEKDIFVYDVSRPIPEFYKKRINFDTKFVHLPVTLFERGRRKIFGDLTTPSKEEIHTTFPVLKNGEKLHCYLPKVVAHGDHLINISILKAHQFLLFSGALKNHFGSIVFNDKSTSPRPFHGEHIHDFIVDVNMNRHLQKITRLVVCDAIVGTWSDENLGTPEKWKIFENDYPSSLFFSTDPFTMDLYLKDIVKKERIARGLPIKPDTFIKKFEARNPKQDLKS